MAPIGEVLVATLPQPIQLDIIPVFNTHAESFTSAGMVVSDAKSPGTAFQEWRQPIRQGIENQTGLLRSLGKKHGPQFMRPKQWN